MAESAALSQAQTEKLLQFQDLTGNENTDECRKILEAHRWDIEVAVQAKFAQDEGRDDVYREQAQQRQTTVRTPTVDIQPFNQRIYTVARPHARTWFQWGYYLVFFPFKLIYSTVFDVFRFAYRLVRPDPRLTVTDAFGDVRRFIERFEAQYGPLHPAFFNGTYSQALNEAKTNLQFLLVYLHDEEHPDTDVFCRETLCDPDLSELLIARVLFWASDIQSPEGFRVSRALRAGGYPFLCLIVLRNNKMTLVARIQGPFAASELCTRLTRLLNDNEASLIAARTDREERSFNQSLRDEQDQAYLESLKADQEKERKKREEEMEKERAEQRLIEQKLEEQQRLVDLARRKDEIRDSLPVEPDTADPGAIKVLLKLPNGTRLERHFLKSQSLKHLYNYVFVHEAAPDDFQIVTNFPRKVLPCKPTADTPEPCSFEDVGLGKAELLFVHDNDA